MFQVCFLYSNQVQCATKTPRQYPRYCRNKLCRPGVSHLAALCSEAGSAGEEDTTSIATLRITSAWIRNNQLARTPLLQLIFFTGSLWRGLHRETSVALYNSSLQYVAYSYRTVKELRQQRGTVRVQLAEEVFRSADCRTQRRLISSVYCTATSSSELSNRAAETMFGQCDLSLLIGVQVSV